MLQLENLPYHLQGVQSKTIYLNNKTYFYRDETPPPSYRRKLEEAPKSERKGKAELLSVKIDFLSRVASPRKSPKQDEAVVDALENAKFFTKIQSDKERRTIKIRLAQMTGQYTKSEKKAYNETKANRDTKEIIINKFLTKKEEAEYKDYVSSNQPGSLEALDKSVQKDIEKTKTVGPLVMSVGHSRRTSCKPVTDDEFTGLYCQKLLKGRPVLRTRSPSKTKVTENNSKPTSLNELYPTECGTLSKKSDSHHGRRLSSTAIWSLNSIKETEKTNSRSKSRNDLDLLSPGFKPAMLDTWNNIKFYPQTDKAAKKGFRRLDSIELINGLKTGKSQGLSTEIDRELMILPELSEKEKTITDTKTSLTNDTRRKKTSASIFMTPVGSLNSLKNEGLKERSMYAQLNEVKEWRMKVFKKPQKRASISNQMGVIDNTLNSKFSERIEG